MSAHHTDKQHSRNPPFSFHTANAADEFPFYDLHPSRVNVMPPHKIWSPVAKFTFITNDDQKQQKGNANPTTAQSHKDITKSPKIGLRGLIRYPHLWKRLQVWSDTSLLYHNNSENVFMKVITLIHIHWKFLINFKFALKKKKKYCFITSGRVCYEEDSSPLFNIKYLHYLHIQPVSFIFLNLIYFIMVLHSSGKSIIYGT